MNIAEINEMLKSINFDTYENNGLLEFRGIIKDSNGMEFDLEGSMELDDEKLVYSLSFIDMRKGYEYDGIIGKLNQFTKDDVLDLITPNFVEI